MLAAITYLVTVAVVNDELDDELDEEDKVVEERAVVVSEV